MEIDGSELLISPDGVVPTQIVGVSASCYLLPSTIKYRSFLLTSAHTGGPGKRAIKMVVCVCEI